MDEAIEIVQKMYDEVMAHYNAIPSYIMASEATLERIETLEEVLGALRAAKERELEEFKERRRAYMRNLSEHSEGLRKRILQGWMR